MNIFIITDNLEIYIKFRLLFSSNYSEMVSYFISKSSETLFINEMVNGEVKAINLKEDKDVELLLSYNLGFSCHSKQIFPETLVKNVRCINVHPGFNPYNRGWYPQVFSIINKLPAGVTIHEMDKDIDHGGIICQETVDIYEWDTSLSAYQRIVDKEIELFSAWLSRLIRHEYTTSHPYAEGNYNSRQDFRDICEINLDKMVTFREAIDFLRALTHPPYKNAYFRSEKERVFVSLDLEKRSD